MLERITEDAELIKALRCGGHNMIFHYCDKEDCPYCQYSYHDNLHRCNVQELGIDAADAIEELISRVPKWVSVKDELPSPIHPSDPDYRPYLIIADGYMYVADYSYDKYFETCYSFYVDGEEMTGVTHWCKIPEPPKGE